MNALQCWRAARAQTSSGRYRTAAFAGLAAAAIVCGPVAGQNQGTLGEWNDPEEIGPNWKDDFGLVARHAAHLPNGSILLWNHPDFESFVWDPVSHTLTKIPTDLLINCSGHAGLPDGTLLVAGGSPPTAQSKIYTLDGCPLCPWLSVDDMVYARFYPTCTTLPNGPVLVTGGRDDDLPDGNPVLTPEIFTFDPVPDPPEGTWAVLDVETLGTRTYPHMFVVPDDDPDIHKVFFSSSHRPDIFDLIGTTYMLDITDVENPTWTAVGGDPPFHTHDGSAVMYEPGKVLKSGGDDATLPEPEGGPLGVVDQTATINLNDSIPVWQSADDMVFPRLGHTLVLLADGKILAVGGENEMGAVEEAEWFRPALGTWQELAFMELPRGHHSSAVLLADARVLSAGGQDGTAEIFSPPYLFDANDNLAPPPVIGFAPRLIRYGTTFRVEVQPALGDPVARVTLLRLGSVTHGVDQNQRFMELTFTEPIPGRLQVDPPDQSNQMPPGSHMLFVISANGVPSIAKYVRLAPPPSP